MLSSLCKYLMVACGRASILIQHARAGKVIKVWDHAVGVICVHEAGGKNVKTVFDTTIKVVLQPPRRKEIASRKGEEALVARLWALCMEVVLLKKSFVFG